MESSDNAAQRPLLDRDGGGMLGSDDTPLAARMRPRTLDEFVGQSSIVGVGRLIRRAIESDRIPSMVFWGPPGCGKTTLAEIIAQTTNSRFVATPAISSGVADLRKAIDEARRLRHSGIRTILFIDEIHRFNKAQQDAVLQSVERGDVTLIGATTENPSFEVNGALLSRCRVFRLEALTPEDLGVIVDRALRDAERGIGALRAALTDDARQFLIAGANGDARTALNALELAARAAQPATDGTRRVTRELVEEAMQHKALLYDQSGDQHYHLISAFIKSIRGSDPDAAIYWLARMLEAGEDPLFVARRLVILAAEDVGLADPRGLTVAVAAQQAAHFIGMPEGYLPLAEATLYLATAPKSNSAIAAYQAALEDVRATLNQPVPLHLRNAVTGYDRAIGYGKGYRYAHDFPGARVQQQHLPDGLVGRRYYKPNDRGYEKIVAERMLGAGEERKPNQVTSSSQNRSPGGDERVPPGQT